LHPNLIGLQHINLLELYNSLLLNKLKQFF
jgi:hypothetical protein